MKKIIALLLTLVITAALFSCGGSDAEGSATVVLDGKDAYVVTLSEEATSRGLLSLLDVLVAEKKLTYETDPSGFLLRVGDVAQDAAAGKYVYIYSSVAENDDVSTYATTVEWEGKTLTSVGLGANELAIRDGGIYYIGLVQW